MPWRPVIRIATPFSDRFGRKSGVLVANLNASDLLDEFEILFNGDSTALRMMNDEGYWVFHPVASKSFGFMTGSQPSMAEKDLKAWSLMSSNERGRFDSTTGHYVYDTIITVDEGALRFSLRGRHRSLVESYRFFAKSIGNEQCVRSLWLGCSFCACVFVSVRTV